MKVLSVINNDKDAVTKEYVDNKAGVTAVDPTSGPVETNFFIPTKTSDLTNDSGFITSTVNNLANYTTTSDLNTALNNIEDGIEDIDDRVTDNEQDIITLNNTLDMINDTTGSDWQEMMKNKLDYCINNINTTKTNIETFINGGWYGRNYGFGVFSKLGNAYQLVWYSTDGIYFCRNVSGTYDYRSILWTN